MTHKAPHSIVRNAVHGKSLLFKQEQSCFAGSPAPRDSSNASLAVEISICVLSGIFLFLAVLLTVDHLLQESEAVKSTAAPSEKIAIADLTDSNVPHEVNLRASANTALRAGDSDFFAPQLAIPDFSTSEKAVGVSIASGSIFTKLKAQIISGQYEITNNVTLSRGVILASGMRMSEAILHLPAAKFVGSASTVPQEIRNAISLMDGAEQIITIHRLQGAWLVILFSRSFVNSQADHAPLQVTLICKVNDIGS